MDKLQQIPQILSWFTRLWVIASNPNLIIFNDSLLPILLNKDFTTKATTSGMRSLTYPWFYSLVAKSRL